jgi:hypothetical protein
MKTLIIVASTYTGATRKVADAIAEELKAIVQTPEEVTDLSPYDVIGIGSGIRFGSFDNRIMSFVRNALLDGEKIFIFSTRCRPILGDYHKELTYKQICYKTYSCGLQQENLAIFNLVTQRTPYFARKRTPLGVAFGLMVFIGLPKPSCWSGSGSCPFS